MVMKHAYYGQDYSDAEIRAFLDGEGIPIPTLRDDSALLDRVVDEMSS